MKKPGLILICFITVLLPGCYDLSEELWINADGSGRMKFTIGLAESLLAMVEGSAESTDFCDKAIKARRNLEDNELVTAVAISKLNEAGMHYCTIDIGITDFRKFGEVRNSVIEGDYDKYQFPFLIEQLDAKRFRISQQFNNLGRDDPAQSEMEKVGQEMAMVMMTPMLSGRYLSVIVHAPKIESSNGDISKDSRTTTWKKPLIDLVRNPQQPHKFEMIMLKDVNLIDRFNSWWNSF